MNVTIYSNKKWNKMMMSNDQKLTQQVKRKLKLNSLILNWMIVECHINAVISFSKDLGLELDEYISGDGSDGGGGGGDWMKENKENKKKDGDQEEDDLNEDLEKIELIDEFDNLDANDDDFFNDGNEEEGEEEITINDELMINNLKSMRTRYAIKTSILRGDIKECFELINMNYPNLFDKNHLIYFKLLHLQLIEMIREHVILKAQQSPQQLSEVQEREFLDNVMKFVKLKLSSLKILSNKIFIKDLELTMVLLCYTDELTKLYKRDPNQQQQQHVKIKIPLKLKKLFDKSTRYQIAKLVNKSILLDINNDDDINLINYNDDDEGITTTTNSDTDLLLKFNMTNINSDNVKLTSLIKLWIWSENELSKHDVIFPGINLNL